MYSVKLRLSKLVREYHYPFCVVVARKPLRSLSGAVLVARPRHWEVMVHPLYGSAQKERIRFALYCAVVIGVTNLCSHRRVPPNSVLTAQKNCPGDTSLLF